MLTCAAARPKSKRPRHTLVTPSSSHMRLAFALSTQWVTQQAQRPGWVTFADLRLAKRVEADAVKMLLTNLVERRLGDC